MTRPVVPPPTLDLGFLNAATVTLPEHARLDLILVGCGGTGSFASRSIAQIARVLIETGRRVRVTFVDPDIVEPANVPRQMFAECEIGMAKADALTARYAAAWGLKIRSVAEPFSEDLIATDRDVVTVMVGCVDNAAARRSMHEALARNSRRDPLYGAPRADAPYIWWLDCGNAKDSGQCLLGTATTAEDLAKAFPAETICTRLPSPALECPELLEPRPEELAEARVSCAELVVANAQSLTINQRVAAEAATMLTSLLITRNLKRFATYFDAESGTSRSLYCTPEQVQGAYRAKGMKPRRARRRAA